MHATPRATQSPVRSHRCPRPRRRGPAALAAAGRRHPFALRSRRRRGRRPRPRSTSRTRPAPSPESASRPRPDPWRARANRRRALGRVVASTSRRDGQSPPRGRRRHPQRGHRARSDLCIADENASPSYLTAFACPISCQSAAWPAGSGSSSRALWSKTIASSTSYRPRASDAARRARLTARFRTSASCSS